MSLEQFSPDEREHIKRVRRKAGASFLLTTATTLPSASEEGLAPAQTEQRDGDLYRPSKFAIQFFQNAATTAAAAALLNQGEEESPAGK